MDREEVDKMLYEIREKSNNNTAKEFFDIMEDLFKIKPVTMLYFNVKAKLLCDVGQYEDAIELLTVTSNLILPDEEVLETCMIFQRAFNALGKETLFKQWYCMEQYIRYSLRQDENAYNIIEMIEDEIFKIQNSFLNEPNRQVIQRELANKYYESWYSVEGTVMYALSLQGNSYKGSLNYEDRIRFEVNHTFLLEQLLNENGTYVLLTSKEDYNRTMTIAKALTILKKQVYVIMPSVSVAVEYEVDLKETVKISIDNSEIDNDGVIKIMPLDIMLNGEIIANNTNFILEYLSKKTENDFLFVLGSANIFTLVNDTESAKKRMQRLSEFRGDLLEGGFAFGYYGKYTSYISKIYGFDVQKEIDKPSEYEFSIVIPVRNSVETLRYTLQTCLEQRNIEKINYEIVVSDNSNSGFLGIEELLKQIDDPRIKYYRVPKYLNLNRSFEYAFLKAKGEFVFSIGADDAVLPWGLETLRKVLKELPNDDLIEWDRGFFIWSDKDIASSQAGEFVIPRNYNKNNIKVTRFNTKDQLSKVLENPNSMYEMPMLYINSGFRRRYLNRMIEETGRLWDGMSQDVYIGLANLMINKTIPYLQYPITIAGMSCNSIGLQETNVDTNIKSCRKKLINNSNSGVSVVYGEGLKFTPVSLDISLVYFALYRYVSFVPNSKLEKMCEEIDWIEIFKNVTTKYNCEDINYDYFIKYLRYSAYCHGEKVAKCFEDDILKLVMIPKTINRRYDKCYTEGFILGGGLQLDARKFGAKRVNEAARLFTNICNL